MEIYAYLHAILCRSLTKLNSRGNIIVSTAVPISVLIIRVVPYTKSYVVDTRLGKRLEHVLLLAVKSIVLRTAVLNRKHRRGIHSSYKVIGNVRYRLNKYARLLRSVRQCKRRHVNLLGINLDFIRRLSLYSRELCGALSFRFGILCFRLQVIGAALSDLHIAG